METKETRQVLDELGIVPLKADRTHPSPEADELLVKLGNKSKAIPFYAIFPGNDPTHPIVLDGLLTSPAPLVAALKEAAQRDSTPNKIEAETTVDTK